MPNFKHLIRIQAQIASKVLIKDDFKKIRYVAGADVSFDNKYAYGSIVVMKINPLSAVDCAFAKKKITIPYIPTFLAFREQAVIVQAYQKLKVKPDILLCDGQGIAHPRKAGLACALGVLLNIPTIGVAKTNLCGEYQPLKPTKNSFQYLYYNQKPIGVILRTQANIKPVFVSPGHKV
ncbi:MAG: endonuclease V, partial [candidate division WOR-3 bacterium]|nr:endonuclease V [candidate division WOR-3 bacterium]